MIKPSLAIRITVTMSAVLVAILIVGYLFRDYLLNPWTRDGEVRANVIQMAPRINGPIVALPIKDNQFVRKGDLLFEIDPRTFKAAVSKARADLKEAEAKYATAKDQADRARKIRQADSGAVAGEALVAKEDAERLAEASVMAAQAVLDSAQLELDFTRVVSPVNGYVTFFQLDIGTQAVANQPLLALVDSDSFWVAAFFRETLLENLNPGDTAIVKLMSYPDKPIESRVESIGWGISKKAGQPGYNLLPEIKPSFEWIRLAQRIPVRVRLGKLPEGVKLRVGMTASVIVLNRK
ncbi:MAG: efflux RND transporter periplasmic adaptor subunit [Planctomycetota bacterium]